MYIFKTLINHILFFLIYFISHISAKEIINILINKPDIDEDQFIDNYNDLINQYFIHNNIQDFEIKFSYCIPDPEDGQSLINVYKSYNSPFLIDIEYAKSFNCILRELKQSHFDLMVLDDRILYSDNSYLDNTTLQSEFSYKKLIDYLATFKIDSHYTNHHDKTILNDGYLDTKNLYGLPYEFDFDLLYYHSNATDIKDSLSLKIEDIQKNGGDEKVLKGEALVSAGLKDNDELLNLFGEFLRYQYDTPKEENPMTYNILSKDKKLYDSLRNYLNSLMGDDIDKILSTTIREAYHSFLHGEKPLYKGKASLYSILNKNKDISVHINALPENKSVIYEKYLVMNKNSLKSMKILEQIALQLTSKEMQEFRALQFGTIPTFDFKNENEHSNSYCQAHSEICELLQTLNPIRIRNIVKKEKYSASFLESRLIVPMALRQSLIDPKNDIIQKTFLNTLDIWNKSFGDSDMRMEMNSFLFLFLIINLVTIFVAIFLLFIIFKVYRNRKHPYIKAMSPQLTNITILGVIMRIIYPYFYQLVSTRFLCRMSSVLNFFINNLVYIPLFAIIFRIYYIFTNISSVSYGEKVHDKKLIIYITIALFISFFAYYGISYFDYFNLTTSGSLTYYRFMICTYDFDKHSLFSNIYTSIFFIIMMAMTIKIRKLSKKYGDTRFIFFIVLLLLSSFFFEIGFASFFKTDGASIASPSSLILICIHMFISNVMIYFLIGNRLIYIRKHPVKNIDDLFKNDFDNIFNLVNFIPVKRNFSSSFTIFGNYSSASNILKNPSNPNINNDNTIFIDTSNRVLMQSFQKYLNIEENINQNNLFNDNANNINYNGYNFNDNSNSGDISNNYIGNYNNNNNNNIGNNYE